MNESDLLVRAKEERDEIFARYDRGRENANLINKWEESSFEVYNRADRFEHFILFPDNLCPTEN